MDNRGSDEGDIRSSIFKLIGSKAHRHSMTRATAYSVQTTKLQKQTEMSLNLVHRNKKANDIHEGKWNGLGGKFEAGETPEECIIREV